MKRISSDIFCTLHTIAQTQALEKHLAALLPPHTLMAKAGEAVAKLAKALVPHAKCIWIACGPGNNGGDGLVAAARLAPWAKKNGVDLRVSWCGDELHAPLDAQWALSLARSNEIKFTDQAPPQCDLVIDAILGIGCRTTNIHSLDALYDGHLLKLLAEMHSINATRLCVDVPSGLNADNGSHSIANYLISKSEVTIHTLSLLTLKPGLFTADGRDSAGQVWFDDLGADSAQLSLLVSHEPKDVRLGPKSSLVTSRAGLHSSHKGTYGDVWVLGGQHITQSGAGMTGAAVLAARAALNTGAGRAFVIPLGEPEIDWDPAQPELMFRSTRTLNDQPHPLPGSWVCGCGGGSLVVPYIPLLLRRATALVLDADALNAIALDPLLAELLHTRWGNSQWTVATPHPLEAARLLGCSTRAVQADRLTSARAIAHRYNVICVLKGSGTVVATPKGQVAINPSGNAKLATAGTGDVLAGMLGTTLAHFIQTQRQGCDAVSALADAVSQSVWWHGHIADCWTADTPTLTASRLSQALGTRNGR